MYETYALAKKIAWSEVCILCVYIQVTQQLQTQPIKTERWYVWGVDKFMILIPRVMEDTDM